MVLRLAACLFGTLILVGCATTDEVDDSRMSPGRIEADAQQDKRHTLLRLKAGADCPGTTLVSDDRSEVLCFFTYPSIDESSKQKIVNLRSGADCPGRQFDGVAGILCLVQYPRGWTPFVFNGSLFYKIDLAES